MKESIKNEVNRPKDLIDEITNEMNKSSSFNNSSEIKNKVVETNQQEETKDSNKKEDKSGYDSDSDSGNSNLT